MAQWSRADRTVFAKLVYYGPAFGGKTTNLQQLHRLTDSRSRNKLLSVKTADDRTLFFDLLPFELGDILGYEVAMKLYTVPGQVRYDTTRQVVLAGADALVFVADSTVSRREQNVWSLQNLHMNMRAKGLDPGRVPVLYQFNKQDLPEAAPPREVARWLGIPVDQGFPAAAVEGRGVLDTFMAACRVMLENILAAAEAQTRNKIDPDKLRSRIDAAFAPHLARQEQEADSSVTETGRETSIVLEDDDLLARAVQTGVRIGEKLTAVTGRAKRLEREADAFRRISEAVRGIGASFDRDRIIDSALAATGEILEAPVVSLVAEPELGRIVASRVWGADEDPLANLGSGRRLLGRMVSAGGPCVVEHLASECDEPDATERLKGLRGVAAVPVERKAGRTLVAYAPEPDGTFCEADVRFLATVAGHLASGLEKARLHEVLKRHRDELEDTVRARTEQLREAYEGLRSLEQVKDNFLSNLSHEMKTPLTAILSSACVLRDYKNTAAERKELVVSVVKSAETLQKLLDRLFQVVRLESESRPLKPAAQSPEKIVREAVELAGMPDLSVVVEEIPQSVQVDLPRVARAVSNLLDNAVKFAPSESVEIQLRGCGLARDDGAVDGIEVLVMDRGPGVEPEDCVRIFAPFEQGGNPLTSKPPGIGIGLYESRAIAQRHGGNLEYLPRDGGGSTFRLTFPVEEDSEAGVLEAAPV